MSRKRRMDRVAAGLAGGTEAMRLHAMYSKMSDAELLREAEGMARDIRNGRVMSLPSDTPSPLFAHLSDEQLLADYEEGKRQLAEERARHGITGRQS